MDFFEAQEGALRRSRRLVALFALAVVSMMAVVYLVLLLGLHGAGVWTSLEGGGGVPLAGDGLLRLDLLVAVAFGMGLVIAGGSAFRTSSLRRGGSAVAELLGGRPIAAGTTDSLEQRLVNVVEEMSIASGVPVPTIYVMDGEGGINAFAAGHTIHDSAIGVTRGALESLDRDELQGVVAHEFSHILNGDMRLNIRLMGLLYGILLLAVVGRGLLRSTMGRGSGGKGGGAQAAIPALGVVLVLVGYLGVFFGRLIQAGVSRQREFLADAAAVEFTRNPSGIAGALRRIADGSGSQVRNHHAEEVGHFFFAAGLRGGLAGLTATHPPIGERIRRLDPRGEAVAGGAGTPPPARGSGAGALGFAGSSPLASAGTVEPRHLERARALLGGIPESLLRAAREPGGAPAIVIALVLSQDDAVRARQLREVGSTLGADTVRRAEAAAGELRALSPRLRLPLLELTAPALRSLPTERKRALLGVLGPVIQADGRIRTLEFAVYHLVRRALGDAGAGTLQGRRSTSRSLVELEADVELVLSAMARTSSRDPEAAFRAGLAELSGGLRSLRLRPPAGVELQTVDEALGRLERTAPEARRELLTAAHAVIEADGRKDAAELELLRAVAEALDVPLPPAGDDHEGEGEVDDG